MNPSCNLFLIGPTGAGKTSIGRQLAPRFGLAFVDLDREIEVESGADIPLIFELEGEAGFRRREHDQLREFSAKRDILLACGAGIVLDPDNRRLLAERGFVVWLRAGVAQQLARLRRDHSRPLLATPDRRQRLERMARERDPLYAEIADLAVDGGAGAVRKAAVAASAAIAAAWQRHDSTELPA